MRGDGPSEKTRESESGVWHRVQGDPRVKLHLGSAGIIGMSLAWHVICVNGLRTPGFVSAFPLWVSVAFLLIPPVSLMTGILFAVTYRHLSGGASGRARAVVYCMTVGVSIAPVLWCVAWILITGIMSRAYR